MNALAVIISLNKDHSNILAILETSGCLPLKSYIYPTTFIPAIQNYNLFLKTITPILSRSAKTAFNL